MQLRYQPSLDGLRAIAIAAVVLYHATDFTFPATGQLGVDVFFVLSGFLITTILLDEHDVVGEVSLASFYRRRAFRLLPAMLAHAHGVCRRRLCREQRAREPCGRCGRRSPTS